MSALDDILDANGEFLSRPRPPTAGHLPRRRAAIVTSLDGRLVGLLEAALGVSRGDVVEIKVAGPTIPEGENLDSEVIRSLISAIYLLGVREVVVVGHLHAGMRPVDGREVVASMQALGVDPESLPSYRDDGIEGLMRWMGGFDGHADVARVAAQIRSHPYVPRTVSVHTLVIDPNTGALEVVARGDDAPGGNNAPKGREGRGP
jgi:carbonic anhydrase